MSSVLYYSNYCDKCKNIIRTLGNSEIKNEIHFVCIDKRFRDEKNGATYVILENHLHLVLQSDNLGKDIVRLKSYTAKQLIAYLDDHNVKQILDQLAFYKKAHKGDRADQFWQEGADPE